MAWKRLTSQHLTRLPQCGTERDLSDSRTRRKEVGRTRRRLHHPPQGASNRENAEIAVAEGPGGVVPPGCRKPNRRDQEIGTMHRNLRNAIVAFVITMLLAPLAATAAASGT